MFGSSGMIFVFPLELVLQGKRGVWCGMLFVRYRTLFCLMIKGFVWLLLLHFERPTIFQVAVPFVNSKASFGSSDCTDYFCRIG